MKSIIAAFLFVAVASASALAQSSDPNQQPAPTSASPVKWKETVYNFKTVDYSSDVSHSFTFTNTGTIPITINRVTPGCGCTTTEYTKGPILPGKTATVTIKYDSSRVGYFAKNVTVVVGDETFTLVFLGTVKPAPMKTTTTPPPGTPH